MNPTTSSSHPLARPDRALISMLALLTALDSVSIDMYLPGMPQIAEEFSASAGRAQQTLSAFLAGLAIGQGLYGPFLDRYGRRSPLMIGLIIFIIGSLFAALAPSIESLIIARFIQAIGAAAGLVTPRAVVTDLCDITQSARVFSTLMQVMMISPIVAPIIGGWLLRWGSWRSSFWALAVVGVIALLWVWQRCPESLATNARTPLNTKTIWTAYARQLSNSIFMSYSLASGFALASLFAYIGTSSFIFTRQFSLSASQFSYVFALNSIALILGGRLSQGLFNRGMGAAKVTHLGLLLHSAFAFTLVACVFTLPPSLIIYVTLLGMAMSALGLVFGNLTALTMANSGQQAGIASAVMGLIQYLLSAMVGVFLSKAPLGLLTLPVTSGICAMLALGLCRFARSRCLVNESRLPVES